MSRTPLLRILLTATLVGALLAAGMSGFGRISSPRTVRVQWGDTLWALSQRYRVNIAQLASANHMKVSDVLLAGRTIRLPSTTGTTAPVPAPDRAAGATAAERSFCSAYRPPTGHAQLPTGLANSPALLALRPVFARWARAYAVPTDLIEAEAWQESGWSNTVVSPDGAVGIGQLLPATAVFVNQSQGTHLDLNVASDNIELMAAFLGYLLRSTGGQTCQAVAAYYQGLTALRRYGVLPVSQLYVRNVLSLRPRFSA